jgi:hypothetical protein
MPWGGRVGRAACRRRLGAREKNREKRSAQSGNLARVAARPKLTASRKTRLLALLAFGESFEASCRAINVSSTAVRNHAHRHPAFAERLRAVRENRSPALAPVEPLDWRDAAAQLERDFPERWSLPDFEFDPLAP